MITILRNLLNGDFIRPSVAKKPVEVKAEEQNPSTSPTKYAEDIESLRREYGALESGKTINLSLQQALALMPRTRKRSDAYKGLQTELKRLYGVALNVGKPHAYNSKNEQESRDS